jgi:hypothetical protein
VAKAKRLIFRLDAYTPETIPMERLAEYLGNLAKLLGEEPSVHFARLAKGSTKVICRVQREATPKVDDRLARVKVGEGPPEARRAVRDIDNMLRDDNASGALLDEDGAEIIPFPGNRRIVDQPYGPFNQPGALDGVVIRVGGKTKQVPIHLLDRQDNEIIGHTTREIARELAKFIFGAEIRCIGTGRWYRDHDGAWEMRNFTISSFERLDNRPLKEVVADLQNIEGDWSKADDPWSELARIRGEGDGE